MSISLASSFLLDTHIWLWYVNGNEELKKATRTTISTALYNNAAYLAAISLWEISMLEQKRRIVLGMSCLEWINKSIELTHVRVVPLTPAIATESCHLPGKFHEDPADRMIAATARIEGLTLITCDEKILAYGRSKHIHVLKG